MSKELAQNVSESVRKLAADVKSGMTISGGVISANDSSYTEHLQTHGLTIETVRNVQTADNHFIAATTLAVSEIADAAMKEDNELNQVTLKTSMGHNTISAAVTRPASGENGKRPLSVVTAYNTVDHTGDIRTVTDHLTKLWLNAN